MWADFLFIDNFIGENVGTMITMILIVRNKAQEYVLQLESHLSVLPNEENFVSNNSTYWVKETIYFKLSGQKIECLLNQSTVKKKKITLFVRGKLNRRESVEIWTVSASSELSAPSNSLHFAMNVYINIWSFSDA